MNTYQCTFFDGGNSLAVLAPANDLLGVITQHIDIPALVKIVEPFWRKETARNSPCGRKPWNSEVMLRVLLLKHLYNLSDEQTEFQLKDRLSFRLFVGLGLLDAVPDSRTIWKYNEALSNVSGNEKETDNKVDGGRKLFEAFNEQLRAKGLLVEEGSIVDATFVLIPIQRNTPKENKIIKEEGRAPDEWNAKPRKIAQKDTDARWVKKGGQNYYGYKDHIKSGVRTKFIREYSVTDASVHDSQELLNLLDDNDKMIYADSAYSGRELAKELDKRGIKRFILEKGTRGHPLTEEQILSNNNKSKKRVRVEHIFATVENSMGRIFNRAIGIIRNRCVIGFRNFCYNVVRCVQLIRMSVVDRMKSMNPPVVS